MEVSFFNREIENPVLRVILVAGAAVFSVALVALLLAVIIPVLGAVLTGVFLIVAVVLLLVLIFVPFISFLGLVIGKRTRGSGVEESRTLELESFDSLKVSGSMKVLVRTGEQQSVILTTDDNLLDSVKAEVQGNQLALRFSTPVSSKTGLKLDITVPVLKKLSIYGSADVKLEELDTDSLEVRISGAASLQASGSARSFSSRISGAGKIKAGELIAEEVTLKISGAGKADVHAAETLTVRITGAGHVSCAGNPGRVNKHISGAGKLSMV